MNDCVSLPRVRYIYGSTDHIFTSFKCSFPGIRQLAFHMYQNVEPTGQLVTIRAGHYNQ